MKLFRNAHYETPLSSVGNSSLPWDAGDKGAGVAIQFQVDLSGWVVGSALLVRRSIDNKVADQCSRICIGIQSSGKWLSAGSNPFLRNRDADFLVPSSLMEQVRSKCCRELGS